MQVYRWIDSILHLNRGIQNAQADPGNISLQPQGLDQREIDLFHTGIFTFNPDYNILLTGQDMPRSITRLKTELIEVHPLSLGMDRPFPVTDPDQFIDIGHIDHRRFFLSLLRQEPAKNQNHTHFLRPIAFHHYP